MITLDVQPRDGKENLEQMRTEGYMPAVFYGKKTESTPIKIAQKEFIKVWKEAGESGVVTLVSPTGKTDVLIKDIDVNPVSDMPRHADFYVFEKGKKVEVSVPLEFVGSSPAVKNLGCNLVKVLHEISIFADPQNIPHSVSVDISSLGDAGSHILAKDVALPKGVELLEDGETVVAIAEEASQEEEAPSAPVDLSAIEVSKKGKKEDESEEK